MSEEELVQHLDTMRLLIKQKDAYDFLSDPIRYRDEHSSYVTLVTEMVGVWGELLKKNASLVERTKSGDKTVFEEPVYQAYHLELERLYSDLERKTRSKYGAVQSVSLLNWREKEELLPDEDFSRQVQQLFRILGEFNIYFEQHRTDFPASLFEFLICQFYSAAYELAGRRLIMATNVLKSTNVTEVGSALFDLESENYTYFRQHFDDKLRNGIAHMNYLFDEKRRPSSLLYANIGKNNQPQTQAPIDFQIVYDKTVGIILFLMASIHEHALKFAAAIEEALHTAGFL